MESHKIPWFQSTNQRRSEVVDLFWAQKTPPAPRRIDVNQVTGSDGHQTTHQQSFAAVGLRKDGRWNISTEPQSQGAMTGKRGMA